MNARRFRSRPNRSRTISGVERLECRRLLAADLGPVSTFQWDGAQVTAREHAWIVTTESESPAPAVLAGWTRSSLGAGSYVVRAPGAAPDAMASWAAAAGVRGIEPDRIITATQLANDPSFRSLWGMNNTGQTGGVVDADIDAPEAWDVTTGSRSVVVAVVDTGIDYRHPDLAANMWRNPGEVAGDRIDNDGNGFVDDVYGWDFANNDSDPFDDAGHGTHVAGTIGAAGNNGVGVAGVNWQVSLMALKFLSAGGSGTTSAAVAALNYATMMRRSFNVNVVATNNSWGGGGASTSLQSAIAAGGSAGILAIAAAGNDAMNNDLTPHYPSSYSSDAMIAVAATDSANRLATFSNFGVTSVDLAAPGVGVYSTTPNGTYASYSGTSMATPHVAGAVALLAAANPAATSAQIRSAIMSTAVPIAALAGKVATGGLLNVAAAVAAIGGTLPPPPPPPAAGPGEPNDSLSTAVAVTLADGSANVSGTIGDGAYGGADVDMFSLTVAAGRTLTVDIDAGSLAQPSALDSYVRVFNAAGVQLAANDDAAGLDSFLAYTVPASGTYFVGVSSYRNSSYNAATAGSGSVGATTGDYVAKFSVSAPVPLADVIDVAPDPRTTAVAAVLVQFTTAVSGVDVADFTLTRNGSPVSLAGATVTTVDGRRWTLAGLESATATAGVYALTLNAAGSGIVAVDGGAVLAANASDTWTTQVATLVDAGDTFAASAVVSLTSGEVRVAGRIGDGRYGSRDVDMFRVTLVAGQSLRIDVDAQTLAGGSSLDSYVRVFDSLGRQRAANDDDGVTFDSLLLFRAPTAGTYFVGISGYGNSRYNPTQAGSGTPGSTGSYHVQFLLSSSSTPAARIAGMRDAAASRPAIDNAFAIYGANWLAAVAAAPGETCVRRLSSVRR